MHLTVKHNSDVPTVKRRIDEGITAALDKAKGFVSNTSHSWNQDTMAFAGSAMGATVTGTVKVTPTEVILDARLPLFLRPFEKRAETRILGELRGIVHD